MRTKRTPVGVAGVASVLLVTGCASVGAVPVSESGRLAPAAAPASGPETPRPETPRPDAARPDAPRPFDRSAHSTTDPASIWVIVNKTHPISPSGFRPEITLVRGYQVATPAAGSLARLLDAGDREGLGFKIASAFRSFDYQYGVHAATVAARGDEEADRVSARAGHSEHQTGLAVDLVTPDDPACDFAACFADSAGGRWLAAHAWRYGFVVRYLPANEGGTGYTSEPWHLRFVGRPLAAELRDTRVSTLEEFFGVPGGDYPDR